jgi:hypothetical protein
MLNLDFKASDKQLVVTASFLGHPMVQIYLNFVTEVVNYY